MEGEDRRPGDPPEGPAEMLKERRVVRMAGSVYFNNQKFIQSLLTLNITVPWVNAIMAALRKLAVVSGRRWDAAEKEVSIGCRPAQCHANPKVIFSLFVALVYMVQLVDCAPIAVEDKNSWTVPQIVGLVIGAVLSIITGCNITCCLFWWKERREKRRREQARATEESRDGLLRRFLTWLMRDASPEDYDFVFDIERGLGENITTTDGSPIRTHDRECESQVQPSIEDIVNRPTNSDVTPSTDMAV